MCDKGQRRRDVHEEEHGREEAQRAPNADQVGRRNEGGQKINARRIKRVASLFIEQEKKYNKEKNTPIESCACMHALIAAGSQAILNGGAAPQSLSRTARRPIAIVAASARDHRQ
jgi:hypothetical protein